MFSNGIGIDISDKHLRLAWVSHDGSIRALKEMLLPPGFVIDDEVRKPELLKGVIQDMIGDPGLRGLKGRMTILIPESRVFVANMDLSSASSMEDVEAEALKNGQEAMPIPFRDAAIDVEFGSVMGDTRAVSVFATPRKTVTALVAALEEFRIPIIAIESNNSAVQRLIQEFSGAGTGIRMIVDVGHTWINISLYNLEGLALLSRSVKLSSLMAGEASEKLSAVHVEKLCDILAETVGFFEAAGGPVSVYLAGSGDGGIDIASICSKRLKTVTVSRIQDVVPFSEISPAEVQIFAAAIGAAHRSIKPRQYFSKHNFNDAITYAGK